MRLERVTVDIRYVQNRQNDDGGGETGFLLQEMAGEGILLWCIVRSNLDTSARSRLSGPGT